jgi:uncharacterized membrane protein YczE
MMTGASHHFRNLGARYCIISATLLRAGSIAVFLNLTLLATEKGKLRDKTRLFSILTLGVIGMFREAAILGALT